MAHVDAEAVKAILLNRKGSQVVVIHPPFGVSAAPEKAIEGQVGGEMHYRLLLLSLHDLLCRAGIN